MTKETDLYNSDATPKESEISGEPLQISNPVIGHLLKLVEHDVDPKVMAENIEHSLKSIRDPLGK
jgi:hypothetical protein